MNKQNDPAFLFYSKDWIEGTAELMPDEKGVYIDLLCFQHQRGFIPDDTIRLAKLVGISHDDFIKIWDVISCKFNRMDDRLVNIRLQNEMNDRSEKSHKNTIIGTFAGLLRLGKFNQKKYKLLKDSFKVEDFINYKKEEITERLTEWLHNRLKSIEDENEDKDENISYKTMYEKLKKELSIPDQYDEHFLLWLKYKSEKGQTYKETGLKQFLKKWVKEKPEFLELSISESMAQNYDGLFPAKQKQQNKPLTMFDKLKER